MKLIKILSIITGLLTLLLLIGLVWDIQVNTTNGVHNPGKFFNITVLLFALLVNLFCAAFANYISDITHKKHHDLLIESIKND